MIPTKNPLTPAQTRARLAAVRPLPVTYWERGGTDMRRMPQGFDHDEVREQIGVGERAFEAAKEAIREWRMFPEGWTRVSPKAAIEEGAQVLVSFQLLGLWWHNPARIVYTVDERDRFGFAYGTLPGHVEQGEELFSVEFDRATGAVYYRLRAMSRPHWWMAKLVKPYARIKQGQFRVESVAAMRAAVESVCESPLRPRRGNKRSASLDVV